MLQFCIKNETHSKHNLLKYFQKKSKLSVSSPLNCTKIFFCKKFQVLSPKNLNLVSKKSQFPIPLSGTFGSNILVMLCRMYLFV
jgi:hypothetical protein